jgi:hypothetical protein
MIDDQSINTFGIKRPLIMGPSNFSTRGCLEYIRYFKENYPKAWELTDIVATHQYGEGANATIMQQIVEESEGKPFHQSETHASRKAGQYDNLGNLDASDSLRTAISLGHLFSSGMNNGMNVWYYFIVTYPDEFHPGGLLRIRWGDSNPTPYKQYHAFQQLTSSQPVGSYVITNSVNGISERLYDLVTFRARDADTVFINYTNISRLPQEIDLTLVEGTDTMFIHDLEVYTTDEDRGNTLNSEAIVDLMDSSMAKIEFPKMSVNTLKVVFGKEPKQTSQAPLSLFEIPTTPGIEISVENGLLSVKPTSDLELGEVRLFGTDGQIINIQRASSNKVLMNLPNGIFLLQAITNAGVYNEKLLFSNQNP